MRNEKFIKVNGMKVKNPEWVEPKKNEYIGNLIVAKKRKGGKVIHGFGHNTQIIQREK